MVQAHRIKAIAIAGCTAVGKSATALALAQEFDGELIGADSMQIYRGFDIGTGKLKPEDCGGIAHKMIDIVDGDADFSVGEYVRLANCEIEKTAQSGKLPIIVGGTGLYVNALFCGCNFGDAPKDDRLRISLKCCSHFFGAAVMHFLLHKIDVPSAEKISINDAKRVIRALEIYKLRGAPKSCVAATNKPYDDLTIVLTLPREILYERINNRVHKMFEDGLIDEAKRLCAYKNCGSMQALGYKQIMLNSTASPAELEQITAQKTRNYAKRQITYFKNIPLNKIFIDARDYSAVRAAVARFVGK